MHDAERAVTDPFWGLRKVQLLALQEAHDSEMERRYSTFFARAGRRGQRATLLQGLQAHAMLEAKTVKWLSPTGRTIVDKPRMQRLIGAGERVARYRDEHPLTRIDFASLEYRILASLKPEPTNWRWSYLGAWHEANQVRYMYGDLWNA